MQFTFKMMMFANAIYARNRHKN